MCASRMAKRQRRYILSDFSKDYKLMRKHCLDMSCLDVVIAMLASGEVLYEAPKRDVF